MEKAEIEKLRELVAASGLVVDPQIGDGFVFGKARLPAADADINIDLDPEIDEGPADADAVFAAAERFLSIAAGTWGAIIESIAGEVEEAVSGVEVIEATDLRDDLSIRSVVVFADSILLSFAAEKQFPDSWVRAQLGEDLEVEDIAVDDRDDIETVEFDTIDGLLDHLGSDESR